MASPPSLSHTLVGELSFPLVCRHFLANQRLMQMLGRPFSLEVLHGMYGKVTQVTIFLLLYWTECANVVRKGFLAKKQQLKCQ